MLDDLIERFQRGVEGVLDDGVVALVLARNPHVQVAVSHFFKAICRFFNRINYSAHHLVDTFNDFAVLALVLGSVGAVVELAFDCCPCQFVGVFQQLQNGLLHLDEARHQFVLLAPAPDFLVHFQIAEIPVGDLVYRLVDIPQAFMHLIKGLFHFIPLAEVFFVNRAAQVVDRVLAQYVDHILNRFTHNFHQSVQALDQFIPFAVKGLGVAPILQPALPHGFNRGLRLVEQAVQVVDEGVQVVFNLVEITPVSIGDDWRDISLGNPVHVLGRHVQGANDRFQSCVDAFDNFPELTFVPGAVGAGVKPARYGCGDQCVDVVCKAFQGVHHSDKGGNKTVILTSLPDLPQAFQVAEFAVADIVHDHDHLRLLLLQIVGGKHQVVPDTVILSVCSPGKIVICI